MRVLVTGASGFVGSALCRELVSAGYPVTAVVRQPLNSGLLSSKRAVVSLEKLDVSPETDWRNALKGVSVIVHLAAKVHALKDKGFNPPQIYQQTNTQGTLKLARDAVEAEIRRFVYLSSIKVNGEKTDGGPFTERSKSEPFDAYARSKWEAEQGLREIVAESGLELVILRPPLVYGPGVKANFLSLLRLVERNLPMPLGGIDNRRSLLALDNLIDLLRICIEHPKAAGQTFLVSDGEDISTPDLVQLIAGYMGFKARLFPVPRGLMSLISRLPGKRGAIERLWGSLQVDSTKVCRLLEWQPPLSLEDGLKKTVKWYRSNSVSAGSAE